MERPSTFASAEREAVIYANHENKNTQPAPAEVHLGTLARRRLGDLEMSYPKTTAKRRRELKSIRSQL